MSEAEVLEAGRELDALVAEQVVGWQWWNFCSNYLIPPFALEDYRQGRVVHGWTEGRDPEREDDLEANRLTRMWVVPKYSTDISAAFEVVEKALPHIVLWRRSTGRHAKARTWWEVKSRPGWPHGEPEGGVLAGAPTASLVICLAALKAVGEPVRA